MIRILAIDDDKTVLKLLKTHLQKRNYSVEVAEDGARGICKIYQFKPHLITLDIAMEGIEGNELISTIDAFRPKLRVVIVSGYKKPGIKEECLARGAFAFVEKPIDFDKLDKLLREAYQTQEQDPFEWPMLTDKNQNEIDMVLKILDKNGLIQRDEIARIAKAGMKGPCEPEP